MKPEHESRAEAELDELREAVLDDWILITSRATEAIHAMRTTVSWRITRPLRMVRTFSIKADEIGLIPAGQLAAVAIARRLGASR